MAYTQADIDAIKRAIASSTDTVTFSDGRSVRYKSNKDMMDALALAQREVAAADGRRPVRRIRVITDKGY